MITDRQIIETTKALIDENPSLFGQEAPVVQEWLDAAPDNAPEAVRRTASAILEVLQRRPEAKDAFVRRSGTGESLSFKGGGPPYTAPPGGPPEIPARTVMVCPSGVCDFRRKLRQKGQRLFCPDCGAELIPENPTDGGD